MTLPGGHLVLPGVHRADRLQSAEPVRWGHLLPVQPHPHAESDLLHQPHRGAEGVGRNVQNGKASPTFLMSAHTFSSEWISWALPGVGFIDKTPSTKQTQVES